MTGVNPSDLSVCSCLVCGDCRSFAIASQGGCSGVCVLAKRALTSRGTGQKADIIAASTGCGTRKRLRLVTLGGFYGGNLCCACKDGHGKPSPAEGNDKAASQLLPVS